MADRRIAVIGGVVFLIALAALAVWTLTPRISPSVPEGLNEVTDVAVIKETVEVGHLGIKTSTNYLGHKVYLISGKVKNVSEKPIRLIDVRLTFVDHNQKPVHEAVHQAFEPKWKPLEPGTEYQFSAAFENLPRGWNYRIPLAEISRIAF